MASPRYSVIVPVLHFRSDEPVLVSLRETVPPSGDVQILVAEGAQPSLQRNTAFAHAHGEIIVFLDNDCCLGPDFWKELESAFARPEVEIVGGPALLRPHASASEQIFHALLTHPLIVGTISARYAPRGQFRVATQTELILCNLAVRRSVFEKIGPLSTRLYPNEENEWLDRAQAARVGAYYDPALQVFRPQRSTLRVLGKTLFRYGMGRTRQFQVSGWHLTFHQILPLLLLMTLLAVIYGHLEVVFILLWLTASLIIALTCDSRLRGWQRAVAGLVAPFIPLTYALGQIAGWVALLLPLPQRPSDITVFDERGNKVVER